MNFREGKDEVTNCAELDARLKMCDSASTEEEIGAVSE